MRINVRLFGLLPRHVPGYDYAKGIIVETQEGITYGDLATSMLPTADVGLFSVAGIIKRPDDLVEHGEEVNIFMPLAGG